MLLDAIFVRQFECDMQELQGLVSDVLVKAQGGGVIFIEGHVTGVLLLLWLLTGHDDLHLKSVLRFKRALLILFGRLRLFFNQILFADLIKKLNEHSKVLPVVRFQALILFHLLVGENVGVVLPHEEVVLVAEQLDSDVVGLLVCAPD